MSKEELKQLHALLNDLEMALNMNRMAGHDVSSALQAIPEVQSVVERIVRTMP